MRLIINVPTSYVHELLKLGRTTAVDLGIGAKPSDVLSAVVVHLLASAAAGVQRPDSWEADWVAQAFGEFVDAPRGSIE